MTQALALVAFGLDCVCSALFLVVPGFSPLPLALRLVALGPDLFWLNVVPHRPTFVSFRSRFLGVQRLSLSLALSPSSLTLALNAFGTAFLDPSLSRSYKYASRHRPPILNKCNRKVKHEIRFGSFLILYRCTAFYEFCMHGTLVHLITRSYTLNR